MAVPFDTLAALEKFREAGFEEPQAKALVDAMRSNSAELAAKDDLADLATKTDLADLKASLTNRLLLGLLATAGFVVAAVQALR